MVTYRTSGFTRIFPFYRPLFRESGFISVLSSFPVVNQWKLALNFDLWAVASASNWPPLTTATSATKYIIDKLMFCRHISKLRMKVNEYRLCS